MDLPVILSRLKINCSKACYIFPVLIGVALAWGLAIRSVNNEEQTKYENNIQIGRELAGFLHREVSETAHYGDLYIQSLRRAYVDGNRSADAVNRLIGEMPFDKGKMSHVTMLTAEGESVIRSARRARPGVTPFDRAYFKFARDHEGDTVYVSRTQRGRGSGKTIMRVVRRITLADGSFGGVIFAAIEVKQIQEMFKGLGLVPNHDFVVVGTDRIPRASSNADPALHLASFDKAGLWQAMEKSDHGVLPIYDQADGVTRFHAFHRVAGYPLIAVSTIEGAATTQGLARYNKRPYRMALLATVVILILVFAFYRLVQAKNSLKDELAGRLKAESEGQEKSDLLQTVFHNMAQGLLAFSPEGKLVAFNEKYREITGLPEGFLKLGMSQGEVIRFRGERGDFGPGDADEYVRKIQENAARGEAQQTERITTHGKPHIHMRNMMPDGGSIVTTTDISERLEVEQQLRQAQKMEAVGQLTGGVAHDFNNLLAVSLGNVELAEGVAKKGGDVQPFLNKIKRATQRGAALTSQLLAFSRKQTLFPKLIELGELVQGISGLLQTALGETIEISIRSDANTGSCEVDPSLLESAILNLALNARDAMPDGGTLTIQTENITLERGYVGAQAELPPGEYVVLVMTDTGAGMPKDVIDHVFEPFFTTKEVGQGTGLGLSMVYGFVKQSDGHVTIYSEEGQGTTIKLYLPRSDGTGKHPVQVEDEIIPIARGETVLVVEDDPDLRVLADNMLVELGYVVITAPSAREAVEALESQAVDIILSDVVLPGGTSGPKFIAEARVGRPGLKVVFMSGYPADAIGEGKTLRIEDVLIQKPFNMRDLAHALHEALKQTYFNVCSSPSVAWSPRSSCLCREAGSQSPPIRLN
jgi:signal transduction histidine kinase/CheY-like chemotaxis protein